ncbi:CoA pyrophosphatase [Metabacillus litoralis]|uniref:CoA pyrophosphatase n=1 Tax=Metabacillus litoralis TaxID=152268 RepID=A0A5C6VKG2_9BACI|nr:CoA pyrophosphatase [Metabacillus litoralis]TXC86042.1 CoA pyrophosphatase [Metabacillus litoralis]
MELSDILNKVQLHTPSFLGNERFSKYAVLLPILKVNNDIHILFEVRSQELRRQPGEICFPGGRMDKQDQSFLDTAVRETTEELGITQEQITDVYPIDFLLSPYGMIVYPFVGLINDFNSINPNKSEVQETFTVPLTFFLNTKPDVYHVHTKLEPEEDFPFDLIPGGRNYNWQTRKMDEIFYQYENKVIWGLTARILSHFIELLKR